MKLLDSTVFHGPNIHALEPAIVHRVELGPAENWPLGRLGPDVVEALLARLPGLPRHAAVRAVDSGPGLRPDARATDVLAAAAVELQRLAGAEVDLGEARPSVRPGIDVVVHGFEDEETGNRAGRLAFALLLDVLPAALRLGPRLAAGFDFAQEVERFLAAARQNALDQTTRALVREAARRGIPWFRISPSARFVQLGQGRFQKRLHETITSGTSATAAWIARHKSVAAVMLGRAGLPVPRQQLATSAAAAVSAAERVGYPVVVKPDARGKGIGVAVGLETAQAVEAAAREALRHDRALVVETFIPGDDHRLFVVDGRLVAAAMRLPARVVGDGVRSVAALVDEVNRDPRRGTGFSNLLNRIVLDAEVDALLAESGLRRDSVPAAGQVVMLRRTANISSGGTAVDVTRTIHPDNRRMAERAAAAIGLDIAGIDFLTRDITRSYREIGGGICEINGSPGMRPHWLAEGSPDPTPAIVDMLFPNGATGRIPIAAITGTNGKTTTCRMVAYILACAGHRVGLCTTGGVEIDGEPVLDGDWAGYSAARLILADPRVDAAVLETARGGILRLGLGFDRCDVGAVLNVTEDHIGSDGIDSVERMAAVKRLVAEVADLAVLDADDPLCVAMAASLGARPVCYVARALPHAVVDPHLRAGGVAVVLDREPAIVIREGGAAERVAAVRDIPATHGGLAAQNVDNALYATAIAHGLGVNVAVIAQALRGFDGGFALNPGRLNVYDGLPFKVVLDYCHNEAGFVALCGFVAGLGTKGRRLLMFPMPPDRTERDFAAAARIVARGFDRFVCHQGDPPKGGQSGAIPARLRALLLAEGVPAERIEVVVDEQEAVAAILGMARPGDLVVIIADDSALAWQQILAFEPRLP